MKKIIILIMILLLSSFVSALHYENPRIKHWFKFDVASGDVCDEILGCSVNLTSSIVAPEYQKDCLTPNCVEGVNYGIYSAQNEGFISNQKVNLNGNFFAPENTSYCYSGWFNTTLADDRAFIQTVGTDDFFRIFTTSTGNGEYASAHKIDGVTHSVTSQIPVVYGAPLLITSCWNGTFWKLYLNETLRFSSNLTNVTETDTMEEVFYWIEDTGGNNGWTGLGDDIALFVKSTSTDVHGDVFTDAEINDLYFNWITDWTPLNITFKNEMDDTVIEGETFSIYLKTTGFSQLYTSTNPFEINLTIIGEYDVKVSSTNYPLREYVIDVLAARNDLVLYLINSTDSTEITFNIVDEALNPLEDVFVVFTRLIGGTDTVISEEYSDYAGKVVLDLDRNYKYTINFSKTNYQNREITLEPTESEYLITMTSIVRAYNQSVYEGIRYRFEPSNIILNNNTNYNFTFTLNSTTWDVTGCALYLWNGSSILNSTADFTSNSCFLRIEENTFDMTDIISEAVYQIGSLYNFTVSQQYSVIYTYEGDFSLKNFLDDLSDFGMAGFDDFGRMMLALIVIFVITVLAAQKVGFTNPEVLIFLVIAQVWFFSYVNWLYLDFAPIPTILGFDLKKYIIAILISLAGGAFVMRKFTE